MRIIRIAAMLAASLSSGPAGASALRPLVTLDAPVVRLEDLFDDLGAAGQRVLGPAPPPGSRIVVEAAQLRAIARQFGVDWRAGSSSDRVIIDRPGRLLPREPMLVAMRAALTGVGAGEDLEIDLGAFQSPMVPPGAAVDIAVEQMDWDAGSGRFTAQLALTGEGMALQRLRVSGGAQEMLLLPVATRRLNAGSVVQGDDIRMARVRAAIANTGVARAPAEAVGQTLRRQLAPGQPLLLGDLGRTAAIQKGARVTLRLRAAGLNLSATGQALEAGAVGEHIRILNTTSRAIVEGEIIGPDEVRVLPGTQPLVPPGGRIAQAAARGAAAANWSTP